MTTYGVTDAGFVKKSLQNILDEIVADELTDISSTLDTSATSVFGQINAVMGDKLRELWDVGLSVYGAQYPDSANGASLEGVCDITGVTRLAATTSQVSLELFVDDGVTIPVGSVVSVGALGNRFVTLTEIINALGYTSTFTVDAESESTGPIQGLATNIDTIQSPISGWNAQAALSNDTAETYDLDNAQTLLIKVDQGSEQTITFVTGDFVNIDLATAAEVAAVIDSNLTGGSASDEGGYVRVVSDTDGTGSALQVTGGTSNTALDFDTGLIKGFNRLDTTLGTDIETDEELRIRRLELLRITGACTLEAIRAAILNLDDVIQCYIFGNDTDATVDGIPPHAFESVILEGGDTEIGETIFATKGLGIQAFGTETEIVTDSQGFAQTIQFSRPSDIPIYMELTVLTNPLTFPVDGSDQIKAALVALGDTSQIGQDVIALLYKAVPLDITGVLDVTVFFIDDVDPPTGTANITIAVREIATFDSGDIDVTVT